MVMNGRSRVFSNRFTFPIIIIIVAMLLCIVLEFWAFQTNVQKSGLTSQISVDTEEINYYLNALNRERFSEESKQSVRDFVTAELKQYGYSITEQVTDGFIPGIDDERIFINLIADKGGVEKDHILIGAHYDTVPGTNGMDDNASGVAALLAIAKHTQNSNVRFVVFDGEEYNLTGSRYYVNKMVDAPQLMISLETMGYFSQEPNSQSMPKYYDLVYRGLHNRLQSNQSRGNFSASVCSQKARWFCDEYESYASSLDLKVYSVHIPAISFVRRFFFDLFRSDDTPFFVKDVPTVLISDSADFRNPNYHKPTDVLESINPEFISKQANAVISTISMQ